MPYDSIQFWIVTAFFLLAIFALVRPFLKKDPHRSCGCASKPEKTKLTIHGK